MKRTQRSARRAAALALSAFLLSGAAARAETYRGQLAAYAYALEVLTGEKVKRQILWFLRPGVPIYLDGGGKP